MFSKFVVSSWIITKFKNHLLLVIILNLVSKLWHFQHQQLPAGEDVQN